MMSLVARILRSVSDTRLRDAREAREASIARFYQRSRDAARQRQLRLKLECEDIDGQGAPYLWEAEEARYSCNSWSCVRIRRDEASKGRVATRHGHPHPGAASCGS